MVLLDTALMSSNSSTRVIGLMFIVLGNAENRKGFC